MVKIITDSSSLYTKKEADEMGIVVHPLMVTVADKEYRDYEEIDTLTFCNIVREGNIPKSSQPPMGEIVASFEDAPGEVLDITIADGLSGTYQSAESAKDVAENADKVTVYNTRTICGPQRYLVEVAVNLSKEGKNASEIVEELESRVQKCCSFLIPNDFDFLKRGGRLTPLAATIGGFLKIVPVMIHSEDGTRLEKFQVSRTMKDAFNSIVNYFKEAGVNEDYKIFVSHADNLKQATMIINKLEEAFPNNKIEVLELSPAFATQGGPGCIAVQYIKK